jgi:hypothetical protein
LRRPHARLRRTPPQFSRYKTEMSFLFMYPPRYKTVGTRCRVQMRYQPTSLVISTSESCSIAEWSKFFRPGRKNAPSTPRVHQPG